MLSSETHPWHQRRTAIGCSNWTPDELRETFESRIGPTTISVDGFFSLNAQPPEAHLLHWRFRLVVAASELLRRAATRAPALGAVADSLYVDAVADRRPG